MCIWIDRTRMSILDWSSSRIYSRWSYFGFFFFIFWHHVLTNEKHYVIAYMYSVYLLNLMLRFITPLDFEDLCAAHEEAHGGTTLPSNERKTSKITLERLRNVENTYEFKPFMRQMNEFNFWLCAVRASHIAVITIYLDFLDLPVFWPLLVLYFVLLFATTMRQQLQNMIKYRYIPFSVGKKTYGAITRQGANHTTKGSPLELLR